MSQSEEYNYPERLTRAEKFIKQSFYVEISMMVIIVRQKDPKICCIVCISRLSTDCLAPELQCLETVNERKLFIYRKQFIFNCALCI